MSIFIVTTNGSTVWSTHGDTFHNSHKDSKRSAFLQEMWKQVSCTAEKKMKVAAWMEINDPWTTCQLSQFLHQLIDCHCCCRYSQRKQKMTLKTHKLALKKTQLTSGPSINSCWSCISSFGFFFFRFRSSTWTDWVKCMTSNGYNKAS